MQKRYSTHLKSVMLGDRVTGKPISSRKNRWVGILQACKHVRAQPAVSRNLMEAETKEVTSKEMKRKERKRKEKKRKRM